MNFAQLEQVIRDRVKVVKKEEGFDDVSAMLRVEEEVSAILELLKRKDRAKFDNQR